MNPEQFVFWLNGWFEIAQHSSQPLTLNEVQVREIRNHLKLVMSKKTEELSPAQESLRDVLKHIPDPAIWPDIPSTPLIGRETIVTC